MAGNAWGADWGRYHRQKLKQKIATADRKKRTPCVYLLYKVDDKRTWFGEPVLLIKVGRSHRNIQKRFSEQKCKGFVIANWWNIDSELLNACESAILQKCREKYGEPIKGKELFYVSGKLAEVRELVHSVVRQFVGNTAYR